MVFKTFQSCDSNDVTFTTTDYVKAILPDSITMDETHPLRQGLKSIMKTYPIIINHRAKKILCKDCYHTSFLGDCLIPNSDMTEEIAMLEKELGDNWKRIVGMMANTFWREFDIPETNLKDIFVQRQARCPHCGKDLSAAMFSFKKIYNLSIPQENVLLESTTVFDNDDGSICFSQFLKGYGIRHEKDKGYLKRWRVDLKINPNTGQTYFIPPKKGTTKREQYPAHLMNLSYGSIFLSHYNLGLDMDAVRYTFELLAKKKNLPPYLIENWRNGLTNASITDDDGNKMLRAICVLNRIPCLSFEQACTIAVMDYRDVYKSELFGRTKQGNLKDTFDQFIKNCRLHPSKKIRKLISEDLNNVYKLWIFGLLGFRDVNLIERFMRWLSTSSFEFERFYYDWRNTLPFFLKRLIKEKGEALAATVLAEGGTWVHDTAKMYKIIMSQDPSVIYDGCFKGGMIEIHDNLTKAHNQLAFKNASIPYFEVEEQFDMQVDHLTFKRAVDTHELIRVGQQLHICVGSYRDQVLSRHSIIIVARNSSNDPVICIELQANVSCTKLIDSVKGKYSLLQAKIVCNNLPQAENAIALRKWVEALEIDATNCNDYEHIAKNNISMIELHEGDAWNLIEFDPYGNVVGVAG